MLRWFIFTVYEALQVHIIYCLVSTDLYDGVINSIVLNVLGWFGPTGVFVVCVSNGSPKFDSSPMESLLFVCQPEGSESCRLRGSREKPWCRIYDHDLLVKADRGDPHGKTKVRYWVRKVIELSAKMYDNEVALIQTLTNCANGVQDHCFRSIAAANSL